MKKGVYSLQLTHGPQLIMHKYDPRCENQGNSVTPCAGDDPRCENHGKSRGRRPGSPAEGTVMVWAVDYRCVDVRYVSELSRDICDSIRHSFWFPLSEYPNNRPEEMNCSARRCIRRSSVYKRSGLKSSNSKSRCRVSALLFLWSR
jgi:hypothetical protein